MTSHTPRSGDALVARPRPLDWMKKAAEEICAQPSCPEGVEADEANFAAIIAKHHARSARPPSSDAAPMEPKDPYGPVSHEQANESAQRLINSHFNLKPHGRASIPARPDYDDDLILTRYIRQQAAQSARLAAVERDNVRLRTALEPIATVVETIDASWGRDGAPTVLKVATTDLRRAAAALRTHATEATGLRAELAALAPEGTCKKCLRFECICATEATGYILVPREPTPELLDPICNAGVSYNEAARIYAGVLAAATPATRGGEKK